MVDQARVHNVQSGQVLFTIVCRQSIEMKTLLVEGG